MDNVPKARRKRLEVSFVISMVVIVALIFWVFASPYSRLGHPHPNGSTTDVVVRAYYLNNTGTLHGLLSAQGVNLTLLDTTKGSTFSVLTPSTVTSVGLVVGDTYRMTAAIGMSSKSTNGQVGGYGGILDIQVYDNQTISSIAYSNLTN